jgi:hypothetical protein
MDARRGRVEHDARAHVGIATAYNADACGEVRAITALTSTPPHRTPRIGEARDPTAELSEDRIHGIARLGDNGRRETRKAARGGLIILAKRALSCYWHNETVPRPMSAGHQDRMALVVPRGGSAMRPNNFRSIEQAG